MWILKYPLALHGATTLALTIAILAIIEMEEGELRSTILGVSLMVAYCLYWCTLQAIINLKKERDELKKRED